MSDYLCKNNRDTIEKWFSTKIHDVMTIVSDYARTGKEETPESSLYVWKSLVIAKSLEIFDFTVHRDEVDIADYAIEVLGFACIIIAYKVYMGYDYIYEEDKFLKRVAKEIDTEMPLFLVVRQIKEVEVDLLKATLFDLDNKIMFH
uniref:Uncharacterized protein n=1 Tax=viral metagenome TaxID=1070528 RepID=A0A6C0K9I2_9ZZZZ